MNDSTLGKDEATGTWCTVHKTTKKLKQIYEHWTTGKWSLKVGDNKVSPVVAPGFFMSKCSGCRGPSTVQWFPWVETELRF